MFRGLTKCAAFALLACVAFPGCNVILGLIGRDVGETGSPELKPFASEAELLDYFKSQIQQRNDSFAVFDRGAVDNDGAQAPTAEGGNGGSADSADAGALPSPAPGDASLTSGGDDGFSGTTTQERGVDEADVVKTDGDRLYVISMFNNDSVLRIVDIGPGGQSQLLSETTLKGYGRDLYLHDGKVVALTSGGGYAYPLFLEGGGVADVVAADAVAEDDSDNAVSSDIAILPPIGEFVYERPHTLVTVVDVSAGSSTQVLSTTKIDGSVASSRMIDGLLHLVMANYQDYYYDVLPRLGAPSLDLSPVDAASLLPKYTQTHANGAETSGTVVTWENLYRPTDPDGFGVVTVISLDVDDDAGFSALGVVAEPGLIYSSLDALYLTDTNYDWQGNSRTTTDIYKFAYQGRSAIASATGTVPGRILNQYSMGEHNGNLRVASTIDATFSFDGLGVGTVSESQNAVYVLGQSGNSLGILGRVENIAPGETIQSARFIGDKGYVVTFRQIDPFFTMDMSDPTSPRVVGELKVPGFSTFLTPIDENHILAVGQYIPPDDSFGNWGVQLSIFDVTDFANPTQMSNVVLGAEANTSAYSEALWDPKALTYYAEEGVVALPLSIYEYVYFEGDGVAVSEPGTILVTDAGGGSDGSIGAVTSTDPDVAQIDADAPPPDGEVQEGAVLDAPAEPQGFEGVVVFRVSTTEGLTELGRVSTRFAEADYWGASFTRGVFVGQDLFAVTDLGVKAASMSDLAAESSQLFFGLPYDYDDGIDPGVVDEPKPEPVEPVDGGGSTPGSSGDDTTSVDAQDQTTPGEEATPAVNPAPASSRP